MFDEITLPTKRSRTVRDHNNKRTNPVRKGTKRVSKKKSPMILPELVMGDEMSPLLLSQIEDQRRDDKESTLHLPQSPLINSEIFTSNPDLPCKPHSLIT